MENQKLSGYPSIDKPWLSKYRENAEIEARDLTNKTLWDVIEEKLKEHNEIPAIEYFGRSISRQEFAESVYLWARVFKALGVEMDEVVPIYGPFTPEICSMTFALNTIGATAYFLKLAIGKEALAEETKDSKIAVVFDGMWNNVKHEFCKDKYKTVIINSVTESMPSPKKQIVSVANRLKAKKEGSLIPKEPKYISLAAAKKLAKDYTGTIKAEFVANRNAFITSSSGTTVGGIVKGTVATNESTLAQLLMASSSEIQYYVGDKCLNNFPPTASTSLNVLFFLPLYRGLTILLDPRITEKDFYNQITTLKPNIVCSTGSMWETFFNHIQQDMNKGKKFDFSCAKGWTVGGEGTQVHKLKKWNEILKANNSASGLFSGYGSSELFSSISVDTVNANSNAESSKSILGVGIPYLGINIGVFNANGNELPYNERGELWIKSASAMKGYYNKPELTAETIIDGWVHTGDLAEIDENGYLYIWGRVKDCLTLVNGEKLYMFDVANKIQRHYAVDDVVVLPISTCDSKTGLTVHVVWKSEPTEKEKVKFITEINDELEEFLPEDIKIVGYRVYDTMLPYSPTTLKKDKNRMAKDKTNFMQVVDHELKVFDIC